MSAQKNPLGRLLIHSTSVPSILYGTAWKEERTYELTCRALEVGFRGIDTANQRRHYYEAAVGDAIAASIQAGTIERSDLFLQTKYTFPRGQDHRLPYDAGASTAAQVRQSFESSLVHLKTTYIDSLVLHGPSTSVGLGAVDWEAWRAMESLHQDGRARLLGVSNISAEQLGELVDKARVRPTFVQNRCYARKGWDRAVRELCASSSMAYQGFSLLTANASELNRPPLHDLGRRLGRSIPEIIFRFARQLGMISLTGTTSAAHMKSDLSCFDIALTAADMDLIEHVAD